MSVVFGAAGTGDRMKGGITAMPTSTGTIAFWYKPTWAMSSSTERFFFEHADAADTGNRVIHLYHPVANWYYGGWYVSSDYRPLWTSATHNVNQWNHAAITWDLSALDTIIYLNGVNRASNLTTLNTFATSDNRTWGNRNSANADKSLDGKMGEIALWNVVLTPTQIDTLYKGAIPRDVGSPINYWPLRTDLLDPIGGDTMTLFGGASQDTADQPPIIGWSTPVLPPLPYPAQVSAVAY